MTPSLLRLTDMNPADSPLTNGGVFRPLSPIPGGSILITSAPRSARIIVQ